MTVTATSVREPPVTILVVEDEALIRLELTDFLQECGYTVIEAATADEAARILASGAEIDLVFSDIQMPGRLDGFGLARLVRERYPHVKIMLTSGYAKTADLAEDLCEIGPIQPKPYRPGRLLQTIRDALSQRIPTSSSASSKSISF